MKQLKKTDRAPSGEKKTPFWQQPRFRYGSLSTMLLALFLCVVVAANLLFTTLEKRNSWRVDYSFNALTTQSETTLQILAELPSPVHIYALYDSGSEDLPLMELLDRYAAASPLVTWEQTSVSTNPALTTRFRGTSDTPLTNNSIVVYCETTGRYKILSRADFYSLSLNYDEGVYEVAGLTYENEITSALSYVTRTDIPRILVLQGHGELDADSTAVLESLLTSNNYEVVYYELSDTEITLSPEDMLMILSPQRDLMDTELKQITTFTAAGGSLFLTCDYNDPIADMPNYASLLRSYGFVPLDGIVVAGTDETSTYYDGTPIYLIPYMQSTAATLNLVQANTDTLLLTGARAFETPEEGDNALDVQAVLMSGYKAYLRDLNTGEMTLEQQGGDPVGPFALALQAQRFTTTGEISRAFIVGCSTLLTSSQVYAMTDAQQFLLTMVSYTMDAEPINLDIMAKTALRPSLSTDSTIPGVLLICAVPMLVLIIALCVLLPRRRK